jgi:hypothetical protein
MLARRLNQSSSVSDQDCCLTWLSVVGQFLNRATVLPAYVSQGTIALLCPLPLDLPLGHSGASTPQSTPASAHIDSLLEADQEFFSSASICLRLPHQRTFSRGIRLQLSNSQNPLQCSD